MRSRAARQHHRRVPRPEPARLRAHAPRAPRDAPERHDGSAEVIDTGGTYVTLELRIFGEGETPCRVQAQRSTAEAGRFDVIPGQRCASNFRYDGRPVAALTQINEGVAYHEQGRLRIALQGPFVADVLMNGSVVPTEGHAIWRFEGWR
ncbi:MAG: hypothetical protein M5U28_22735 [Sandaracinaceae bacterium]|nr:hypothetical protein [Sandaracinaceae bacterium]